MDEPMTVAVSPTLHDLGWDPGWAAAFLPFDAAGWRPGRVVAAHRDAWVVATPSGDVDAVIAGRLRHEAFGPSDLPAVGDWVAIGHGGSAAIDGEPEEVHANGHHHAGTGPVVIQAVVPRRTAFGRSTANSGRRTGSRAADEQVLAANVDVALVITSLDGDFNLRRLERYLAVAWTGGANPVIVLNKVDVAGDPVGLRVAAEAVAPGVDVRVISALTGVGVAALADDHLPRGRTAVVLGSSGVGKSTLVNALVGHERQRTAAVRDDDSRGRHTTTHRELVRLPAGALLIDTPGIRSLGVAGATDGLESAFSDIAELAEGCRFRDCRHEGEPGCAVRVALDDGTLDRARYASHRKLEREAAHVARQSDPLARAAERRRWKAISASVAVHMQRKYGSDR
jgi:ribosome biogenesis GTPase / thiamine phosphate phosphatase